MVLSLCPHLLICLLWFALAPLAVFGLAAAADFPPPDALPSNQNLPDPLVMMNGTKIITKEQWESKRKPELKALFQHYMYGRLPPTPKKQSYTEIFRDEKALGGKATLSEVKITFEEPSLAHPIHVLFAVPNSARKAPVFLGIGDEHRPRSAESDQAMLIER